MDNNLQTEYLRRVDIALQFIEKVRGLGYLIDTFGISGSTARKDFSSESDLDMFISVGGLSKENSQETEKAVMEFWQKVNPLIGEIHEKQGVLIDLAF